jgi:hypothetical protein
LLLPMGSILLNLLELDSSISERDQVLIIIIIRKAIFSEHLCYTLLLGLVWVA